MRPLALSALALTAFLAIAASPLVARGAAPAGVAHYTADPAKSTLQFTFLQAGAKNQGRFTRFPISFDFSPETLAGSRLEVTVQTNSLTTGDQERDDTLRSDDLLAVAKYPQAQFSATQITRTASGFEALGKLTLRGVTRELRVPFTFRTAAENGTTVGYMNGKTTVRRLDFGVGQGDWKATDQVGNDVEVTFALRLTAAAAPH